MIIIAHRGNINGPNPQLENHPDHIFETLRDTDLHMEVDLRYDICTDKLYFGHDFNQYLLSPYHLNLLYRYADRIFVHSKTKDTSNCLRSDGRLHWFEHNQEPFAITSKFIRWNYPGMEYEESQYRQVLVLPTNKIGYSKYYAVCTDYPSEFI